MIWTYIVPNHVILVAHSAGGMVARTAVLLDNHPQCAVNSIIMLSSPNSR
jgi:triacylglycerol esterase/lipase EstA (alpha/beta hydrolase family)